MVVLVLRWWFVGCLQVLRVVCASDVWLLAGVGAWGVGCRCEGGFAVAMCKVVLLQRVGVLQEWFADAGCVAIAGIPFVEYFLTCFAKCFAILLQVQRRD